MRGFIGNLRMAQKFLLVGLIALVMLAVPGLLVLRDHAELMTTARAELAGLPPLSASLELIRLTQQHRGLSAGVLSGNQGMVAQRQAKQAEVEQAYARLQAATGTLGGDRMKQALASQVSTWQALSRDVSGQALKAPESFARHTALIAGQLSTLEDLSHVGGLVFESDPAIYFLQTAVLQSLPRLTEDLGQMRARGTGLLTRGEASPEDKVRFEAMAAQLARHQAEVDKYTALAIQYSPALAAVLTEPLKAARARSEQALQLAQTQILRAEKLSHPAADYFAAYTVSIDEQFKAIGTTFGLIEQLVGGHLASTRNRLIGLTLGLVLLGTLAAWVMSVATRATTAAVRSALHLAESVAAGDLRSQVQPSGRDELADLLRALSSMNGHLSQVVHGVRQNAENVATASAQIAQGNQDLSMRTEQQAAALEETAATMDELGSTVRSTAEHAREANRLAQGASDVARHGSEVVGHVVETMKGINDSSRRIADITGVIDGIAFQTNILALNAAVEAARAGEQGRGFAVVAGEVRSLAQRAAEAAREIKRLIAASVESVEQGTSQVDRAGTTMAEVVAAIERVRGIVAEISTASSEQSTGVSQVGEAVTQMDHTTQQNAALVEESAAAAESLRQQASLLLQGVAAFKLA